MSLAIIRSVSRILIPASKSFSSTDFVTHLPELRRIVDPVRRLPPWTPPFNSATFHSLTDTRYPKRRPSDKPRRKRANLRPPGPYAWVKCKEGEPKLPNQPNEGSVKRRNEKKRIKQRRAFIVCYTFLDSNADGQEFESAQNGESGNIVTWDDALRKATQEYQHRTYNILTFKCHSFVSNCLKRLKFLARDWNIVNLAVMMLVKGKFVSTLAIAKTFLPFVVVVLVGLALGGDAFITYLTILIFALVGWFLIGNYCLKKLIHV